MHVFSKNAVNTSVKYAISDMLCGQSVASSDFLPHLLVLVVVVNTSSSRASRGRKFQKKKELYSKERICL